MKIATEGVPKNVLERKSVAGSQNCFLLGTGFYVIRSMSVSEMGIPAYRRPVLSKKQSMQQKNNFCIDLGMLESPSPLSKKILAAPPTACGIGVIHIPEQELSVLGTADHLAG